ncbi:hypothetical protein [Natrinema halophilum]|uniref:Uncharacterized protein n=1 Tax=Natrinema halophilum TaxID=1699371 RepID=A0A7D5KBB3_9EURY|nr:hypothetical protein [Natrinema halophilum]QLG47621.1 hypothetical protein HYG82_01550 [Natrinema halophilum]
MTTEHMWANGEEFPFETAGVRGTGRLEFAITARITCRVHGSRSDDLLVRSIGIRAIESVTDGATSVRASRTGGAWSATRVPSVSVS